MTFLFWVIMAILILGGAGLVFWIWLAVRLDDHKPDGQKSMAERRAEERQLPCSDSIASSVKESLLVFSPGVYQYPELDEESVFALLDENYGSISIRTSEMCDPDQPPLFCIDGPSCLGMDDEEYPFESVDAEIAFYLDGAHEIRSQLLEAGVDAPTLVNINGADYKL